MRSLVTMKIKFITTVLLILCGVGIGWLAFQNLMWAIWGKHNSWYEYVGFWGCSIMFISGIVALKSLRTGSFLGLLGYGLMLFYLGPALVNTLREILAGGLLLNPLKFLVLALIVGLPLLTLGRLGLNLFQISSKARA
jgi:hypothetical protein